MQVVIVESPAKAKTINKYLGADYKVLASYGHIRDLPPKDGSVRPDEDFAMDWEVDASSQKHLKEIVSALKGAKGLILATDPDREGEAISWHVLEELNRSKALSGQPVKRVTFNAITKKAVLEAMEHPRELDRELIDAYLARRALDYLVGFTLSPVLWRKLPGSKSAGRVQSVALRMICDRELEIEKFKAEEYWTVGADMATAAKEPFTARLTHLDGKKLDKFDLNDGTKAERAAGIVRSGAFKVVAVEKKSKQRRPYPPFTTSTLQQDASRRLYFSARQTMDIAQKLYEGVEIDGETTGLITYMRTDGVQMDADAINTVRGLIGDRYGKKYLPSEARIYKTKAKNAQEAHEAIRPTDPSRTPDIVAKYVTPDQLKLYELIWKRTVASQMESAVLDQVSVVASTPDSQTNLRASGSTIVFKGFLEAYEDTGSAAAATAEDDEENLGNILPAMSEGQPLSVTTVTPEQHFTQPPPRFSEASLVKALEEQGIGRPSTYASIIQVLQDRKYVRMDNRRFIPEDRGRVVIAFLETYFERYVEYSFTADLEEQLDDISGGRLNWKKVLADFWRDFIAAIDGTKDLTRTAVIDAVDALLEPHLFPARADGSNPRQCPACAEGRIGLKFGKFGSFIGCSRYPECRYTRPLGAPDAGPGQAMDGPKELGSDPATGLKVTLRIGPYGPYVQLGGEELAPAPAPPPPPEPEEVAADGKKKKKKAAKPKAPKPKRASLPKGTDPNAVDLDRALKLLSLPREIGVDPESGEMIVAGIGRFGPYLKYGDKYQSLGKDDDVLEIGLNRAVVVIAEGRNKPGRKGAGAAKTLGNHPQDGRAITLRSGRFGPYVQHGQVRATLPKDMDAANVSVDSAVALLAAKAAKEPATKSKGKGKTARKTADA
ncbi:MAG: type I DNA topoisomerase [Rhodospirillaceae bacterium]|nr:type I DNA topoisomerase [Rhodospirillaceae bacterium]